MKPHNSLTKRTWAELEAYLAAFASEEPTRLNLLILVGNPGLGKSRSVKKALGDMPHCYVEAYATAFQLYRHLYRRRHRPVVIDDVDNLLAQASAKPLLKSLCQTEPVKRMAWHSAAKQLEADGIPKAYSTRSNVCIIANEWRSLDTHIKAIQDRGTVIFFEPNPATVHEKAGEWFADQEIYNFVGQHLHLIKSPSLRTYVTALSWKNNGIAWREELIEIWTDENMRRIWSLEHDPELQTVEQRVGRYRENGWGSRAKYFRYKQFFGG